MNFSYNVNKKKTVRLSAIFTIVVFGPIAFSQEKNDTPVFNASEKKAEILFRTEDFTHKPPLTATLAAFENPIIVVTRNSEGYRNKIGQLPNKTVGLLKNDDNNLAIRQKYHHIDFVTVNDIHTGLKSVSSGEIDALLCALIVCHLSIRELGLNNVTISGKTEFNTRLPMTSSEDQAALFTLLHLGTKKILQEHQAPLENWVALNPPKNIDHSISYLIAIISLTLISIFIYANRRLSQEIKLRKNAEQKIRMSNHANERYRTLFYGSSIGHAVNRLETGEFVSVNQCFADITGYTLDELNSLSYWDLTPKRYKEDETAQINALKSSGIYGPYEKHYIHKQGHEVAVRLNGSIVTDSSGEKLILSVVEDISAYAEAKEKLRLSSLVLENSSEAMLITDNDNLIITVNPAFTKITGYTLDEVRGKNPGHFKSGRHSREFYDKMWESLRETGQWQGEIWDRRKNGQEYAKWLTIDSIKDGRGEIHRYVAIFSDITQRKLSEETIWKQANFDSLTGLPNRRMFHQQLQDKISACGRTHDNVALLLIDLDHFKEVNDTLGHDIGDQLLQLASKRIVACIRESDFVARLGGDEFTIILTNYHAPGNVEITAQKIISKLAEPYELQEEIVHVSASIGITFYPQHAENIKALIKNADQAMYAAKSKGRNCYSHFTQELQDDAQKQLRLSQDLRAALYQEQFQLYFQPTVDLRTNTICKAEALIRWHHPDKGMVPPLEFIPIAENIGIINEIGNWVYHEAYRWKQHWNENYDSDFQISVNMSPAEFKVNEHDFAKAWMSFSEKNPTDNLNVIIEITEGLLLNSDPDVLNKFLKLHDAGLEVAIDDFGTGYSSLAYLKKFDIDYLKIDQSFIRNLEHDINDLALSEAIIVMAHKLGIKVIAEGVETEGQAKILALAGCDFAQGYLYSRPIPPDEFERLLSEQGPKTPKLIP